MMKTLLFAVVLASLALAEGCAKGGNGVVPSVTVNAPNGISPDTLYPTEPNVAFTATTTDPAGAPVTWSLSGTACTGTPNPCGTIDSTTGVYQAPAAPVSATVTAALVSDPSIKGDLGITVIDVTTDVAPVPLAPATLSVGKGLIQTFTAVAVPDVAATQTFTWNCTASGVKCANFCSGSTCVPPIASGLAYYTAQDNCSTSGCVQISAVATLDPTACSNHPKNCNIAKATPVLSRVSGTYAFRFSGYDSSNHATAVAGTFTALNGAITSGVEDELTSSGPARNTITGGSYAHISSSDPNSNNAGTLTLTLPSGIYPNQYQVVLDGGGDIEMIESDGHGAGSGIAELSSTSFNPSVDQVFAFGFTGVDSGGSRVGYAGLIPMDGNGNVVSGLIDVNDNGQSSNIVCGTPPCTVTGTYKSNGNGSWTLALTSPVTMNFDFYIASGTSSKTSPLTFYAISTDLGSPAVSGTMVLQDSTQTYNNAAFKGISVTALTGTVPTSTATCAAPPCTNVSLTLGSTDGNGNFSGQFDQNNAGAILSAAQFPPSSGTNKYTYAASGTSGRYTFNMLGDPTANPVVAPLPFVLYASGANRGFLLDQSSSSVMTGTMNPQGKVAFAFFASTLASTFAAETTSSGSSMVDAIAANLLLTWVNPTTGAPCASACVNGTQYDAANPTGVALAGANPGYTLQNFGNGTIALTAPSTQSYVIYAVDTSGCNSTSPVCATQDFLMMDVDKTNPNASIIFAQQ